MEPEIAPVEAMQLLRRDRHSFLNHIQVVLGWLQLNRPERALQYLEEVTARVVADSNAIRQVPPLLGLCMLDLMLEAETYGVRLDWDLTTPIGPAAPAGFREAVLEALQNAAAGSSHFIAISLGPDGYTVHRPSDRGEG